MYGKFSLIIGLCFFISGCSNDEPPRDVNDISSKNIKTIVAPKITKSSPEMLEIRYAQMSMGFAAGCNPNKSFSSKLNQCAELPENVKSMAINHCKDFNKKAVFLGNKTNFLQMTVSKFRCEAN
jgi:PBP1b-binding outer membrane lipoprotein LpoB